MKFMNLKRFASTALAGVLALSMAAPAFAASNTTTIDGAYQAITLDVTVPTTGSAIINPYGLPYELGTNVSVSGQQITTGAPLMVENRSSVALSASVSITATAKGAFTFEETATTISGTETANKGVVKFQIFPAEGVDEAAAKKEATLLPLFAALDDEDPAGEVQLKSSAAVTGTDLIVLREGEGGKLQDGGAAFFRLAGEVAKKPTTAWVAADGFTAAIAFTFEPGTYAKSAGTIASQRALSMAAGGDTTSTLTLTSALPTGVTATTTTWASDDEDVIAVAVTGSTVVATAKAAGSANVTVTIVGSDGITYTASISLAVAAA